VPGARRTIRRGGVYPLPNDAASPGPLLLFDGECGLCDRTVRWVLDHDPGGALRFAPLQGETAPPLLARHGLAPRSGAGFDTMVLVEEPGGPRERARVRSAAALAIGRYLGGGWRLLAGLAWLVPRPLRDAAYRLVARHRRRLFPAPAACGVPTPEERARFLP